MKSTEVVVAKRAPGSSRATAAKRGEGTIRRTAKRSTGSKAIAKKADRDGASLRKAASKMPMAASGTPEPEKTIPEITLRKTWKGQQQDAEALAKVQHGAIVDQRAHVRATTGHRWTARKTH
jgi:hypothetical protein